MTAPAPPGPLSQILDQHTGPGTSFDDREKARDWFTHQAGQDLPSFAGRSAPQYLDPTPSMRGPNVVDSPEYAAYLARIANELRERREADADEPGSGSGWWAMFNREPDDEERE